MHTQQNNDKRTIGIVLLVIAGLAAMLATLIAGTSGADDFTDCVDRKSPPMSVEDAQKSCEPFKAAPAVDPSPTPVATTPPTTASVPTTVQATTTTVAPAPASASASSNSSASAAPARPPATQPPAFTATNTPSGSCDPSVLGGNWVPAGSNMWKSVGEARNVSVPASGPVWVIDHPMGSISNGQNVTAGQMTAYCFGGSASAAPASSSSASASSVAAASTSSCPSTPDQAASLLGGNAGSWKSLPGSGWRYEGAAMSVKHPGFGRVDFDGGDISTGSTPSGTKFTFWCNA